MHKCVQQRGVVQMSSSQANSRRQTDKTRQTEIGVSREAPPLKLKGHDKYNNRIKQNYKDLEM